MLVICRAFLCCVVRWDVRCRSRGSVIPSPYYWSDIGNTGAAHRCPLTGHSKETVLSCVRAWQWRPTLDSLGVIHRGLVTAVRANQGQFVRDVVVWSQYSMIEPSPTDTIAELLPGSRRVLTVDPIKGEGGVIDLTAVYQHFQLNALHPWCDANEERYASHALRCSSPTSRFSLLGRCFVASSFPHEWWFFHATMGYWSERFREPPVTDRW